MICLSRQDDTCPVSPSKARGEEGHHKPESNSGVAKMSSPHNQLLLSRVAVEAGQEGEAVLTPEQEVVVLVEEIVSVAVPGHQVQLLTKPPTVFRESKGPGEPDQLICETLSEVDRCANQV